MNYLRVLVIGFVTLLTQNSSQSAELSDVRALLERVRPSEVQSQVLPLISREIAALEHDLQSIQPELANARFDYHHCFGFFQRVNPLDQRRRSFKRSQLVPLSNRERHLLKAQRAWTVLRQQALLKARTLAIVTGEWSDYPDQFVRIERLGPGILKVSGRLNDYEGMDLLIERRTESETRIQGVIGQNRRVDHLINYNAEGGIQVSSSLDEALWIAPSYGRVILQGTSLGRPVTYLNRTEGSWLEMSGVVKGRYKGFALTEIKMNRLQTGDIQISGYVNGYPANLMMRIVPELLAANEEPLNFLEFLIIFGH